MVHDIIKFICKKQPIEQRICVDEILCFIMVSKVLVQVGFGIVVLVSCFLRPLQCCKGCNTDIDKSISSQYPMDFHDSIHSNVINDR